MPREDKKSKIIGIVLACLILAIALSAPMQTFYKFPNNIQMFSGEEHFFELGLPMGISASNKGQDIFINGISVNEESVTIDTSQGINLKPEQTGNYEIQFNLFGLIPLKKMSVEVIPPVKVYPGGESIGVKVSQQGVLVVGLDKINTSKGDIEPAKKAGMEVGDTILKINGREINDVDTAAVFIEDFGAKGDKLTFTVRRDHKVFELTVTPQKCTKTDTYRIGLFIKDSTAGVGTMTFIDPKTKIYGALGHIIADSTTQKPIDLDHGTVMESTITGIVPGKRGNPGEKRGILKYDSRFEGDIKVNSHFGIFGKLKNIEKISDKEMMPIALKHQIKTGPASIMTVVDGNKVEYFDIEIEKILIQNNPAPKGMVIKVTDQRLIEKSGGIVQGMSGSPIIQEGKLVGAVTHVFVNDPTKGYGCFIEWMILESKMLD